MSVCTSTDPSAPQFHLTQIHSSLSISKSFGDSVSINGAQTASKYAIKPINIGLCFIAVAPNNGLPSYVYNALDGFKLKRYINSRYLLTYFYLLTYLRTRFSVDKSMLRVAW